MRATTRTESKLYVDVSGQVGGVRKIEMSVSAADMPGRAAVTTMEGSGIPSPAAMAVAVAVAFTAPVLRCHSRDAPAPGAGTAGAMPGSSATDRGGAPTLGRAAPAPRLEPGATPAPGPVPGRPRRAEDGHPRWAEEARSHRAEESWLRQAEEPRSHGGEETR